MPFINKKDILPSAIRFALAWALVGCATTPPPGTEPIPTPTTAPVNTTDIPDLTSTPDFTEAPTDITTAIATATLTLTPEPSATIAVEASPTAFPNGLDATYPEFGGTGDTPEVIFWDTTTDAYQELIANGYKPIVDKQTSSAGLKVCLGPDQVCRIVAPVLDSFGGLQRNDALSQEGASVYTIDDQNQFVYVNDFPLPGKGWEYKGTFVNDEGRIVAYYVGPNGQSYFEGGHVVIATPGTGVTIDMAHSLVTIAGTEGGATSIYFGKDISSSLSEFNPETASIVFPESLVSRGSLATIRISEGFKALSFLQLPPEVADSIGLNILAKIMWTHRNIDSRFASLQATNYAAYPPSKDPQSQLELQLGLAQQILAEGPINLDFYTSNFTLSGNVSDVELNLITGNEFIALTSTLQEQGIPYAESANYLDAKGNVALKGLLFFENETLKIYAYNLQPGQPGPGGIVYTSPLEQAAKNRDKGQLLVDLAHFISLFDMITANYYTPDGIANSSDIFNILSFVGCDLSSNPCPPEVITQVFGTQQ